MARKKSQPKAHKQTKERGKRHVVKAVIDPRRLSSLCEHYRVRRLWLYGSILRSDFRADSDVDVLIEDDKLHPMGLFKLGGLQSDLVSAAGRPVHLTTLGSIPTQLRNKILASARLEYVA
jgi:predicted nucleotidyltransferase